MRCIYGILFLVLGIAGIILPILPGIPFLIIGSFLLGIIPKPLVLKLLKRLKLNEEEYKNSWFNKLLNFIIIKYVYNRDTLLKNR